MLDKSVSQLNKIRNQKAKVYAKLKELNEQEEYLEQLIISELEKEGLTKATTPIATISIKTEVYPNIVDWNKVLGYILKHKEYTLLKKKVDRKVWQEMIDDGVKLDGIKIFEKTTLLFRRRK